MREIFEFKGKGLIVGGGWCLAHKKGKPQLRNPDNFYTVDINKSTDPDAVIDFENSIQCAALPPHFFTFIYFEGFPFLSEEQIVKTFHNAHRLLSPDGIFLYHGGSLSDTSIPELMKASGFKFSEKKEIAYIKNNGSISIAGNLEFSTIKQKIKDYPNYVQYYLDHYKIFSPKPLHLIKIDLFRRSESRFFSLPQRTPTISQDEIKPDIHYEKVWKY